MHRRTSTALASGFSGLGLDMATCRAVPVYLRYTSSDDGGALAGPDNLRLGSLGGRAPKSQTAFSLPGTGYAYAYALTIYTYGAIVLRHLEVLRFVKRQRPSK